MTAGKRIVNAEFPTVDARRVRVAAAQNDVSQSELLRAAVYRVLDDPEALNEALTASAARKAS